MLQLSKLHLYELLYNKLEPYLEKDKTQIHHMDFDSFVLSIKTQNFIIDLKNLDHLFNFNNLDENHELFSKKNKKVLVKFKPLKALIQINSLP